ncbi:MAG: hypothetical protein QG620_788 [Patescibacteria group bacterium]|nr:hypothetical protein [Patescibacteria group bacterium]
MRRREILPVIVLSFCLFSAGEVLAQSWWGDGVKSHDWILKHGGALIRFEIVNKSGEAWEYKTVMTRSGKNIEAEVGKQGIFDDAKPGREKPTKYKVTFYRGGDGQKNFDNKGSEIKSITLDLHAGEFVTLKLDYSKKKISMRTDYVKLEEEENEEKKELVKPKVVEKVPVEVLKEAENGVESVEMEDKEVQEQEIIDDAQTDDGQKSVWMSSLDNWGNKVMISADVCFSKNPKLAAYNASNFGFCGDELSSEETHPDPEAHFQTSPEKTVKTADAFDFFKSLPSIFFRLDQYLGMNVLAQSGR